MTFCTAAALRRLGALGLFAVLSACSGEPAKPALPPVPQEYQAREDLGHQVPHVAPEHLVERNQRRWVDYNGPEGAGTIVVDPYARLLYHVTEKGRAMRFSVAVGKAGKGFKGAAVISRKEEYPSWTPTKNMVRSDPALYGPLAGGLPGGLDNPLGSRALYLYRGGKDTMYRIHGTMDPASIGRATSAGCIRLFNQDIIDLYDETKLGTRVKVRTLAESLQYEGPVKELHTGLVVPEAEIELIEADQKAYEAGLVADQAKVEEQEHAAAVVAAQHAGN